MIDSQLASLSWCQATIWGPVTNASFLFLEIILRQLQVCRYGVPSLTKGWVCNLQLLLGLARTVFLRSGFMDTHDQILLPKI
jgi:hypothetical protein